MLKERLTNIGKTENNMPKTINSSEVGGRPFSEATAPVKEKNVRALLKAGAAVVAEDLSGTGFTYRHDWGNKHGGWKLTLNWGAVNHNSRVFVSTSEFGGEPKSHLLEMPGIPSTTLLRSTEGWLYGSLLSGDPIFGSNSPTWL